MIKFQYWYDNQEESYIVGYHTPGLISSKTATVLCSTEHQAITETERLNKEQQRKQKALDDEQVLLTRRRIVNDGA